MDNNTNKKNNNTAEKNPSKNSNRVEFADELGTDLKNNKNTHNTDNSR